MGFEYKLDNGFSGMNVYFFALRGIYYGELEREKMKYCSRFIEIGIDLMVFGDETVYTCNVVAVTKRRRKLTGVKTILLDF